MSLYNHYRRQSYMRIIHLARLKTHRASGTAEILPSVDNSLSRYRSSLFTASSDLKEIGTVKLVS